MRSTLMSEKTLNDLFLTTLKDVYYGAPCDF
jgi:ferritin-like metal-binding protein YciE